MKRPPKAIFHKEKRFCFLWVIDFYLEIPTERAWMLFRVQVIYWICWEMMLISINLIRRVRSIRTAACRARFDLSSLSCRDARVEHSIWIYYHAFYSFLQSFEQHIMVLHRGGTRFIEHWLTVELWSWLGFFSWLTFFFVFKIITI